MLCERPRIPLEIRGAGRAFQVDEMGIEPASGEALRKCVIRIPGVRYPQGQELDFWGGPLQLENLLRSVVE